MSRFSVPIKFETVGYLVVDADSAEEALEKVKTEYQRRLDHGVDDDQLIDGEVELSVDFAYGNDINTITEYPVRGIS